MSLAQSLVEDHREHRPTTARDAVLYAIEVWAAIGLFVRALSHTVSWGLIYQRRMQNANGEPALGSPNSNEHEWGLTLGCHLERDGWGDEPTDQQANTIQTISAVWWTFWLWQGYPIFFTTVSDPLMLPLFAVAFGPSVLVLVLDPLLGAIHTHRSQTTSDTNTQSCHE